MSNLIPDFDDLVFLGASMSRYPLEGYRETCNTSVILGDRFAKKPIKLDIPIGKWRYLSNDEMDEINRLISSSSKTHIDPQ